MSAPKKDAGQDFLASPAIIAGFVLMFDFLSIVLASVVAYVIFVSYTVYSLEYYVFAITFIAFVTLIIFNRADLYTIDAIMRPIARSDVFMIGLLTSFLFFLTVAFSTKVSEIYSRLWMYGFAGFSLAFIVATRLIAYRVLRTLSRQSVIGRAMVVLGAGPLAAQFVSRIDRVKPYFTAFRGVYLPDVKKGEKQIVTVDETLIEGGMTELKAAARRGDIDDVVVAMPWTGDEALTHAVNDLKELPINVYISTDLSGYQLEFRPAFGTFERLPMFEVVQRPISGWSQLLKTLEDYVISALLLLLVSPVMLITAIAIKLESKGPVLFKQRRLGFNNHEFSIYKFRSMYQQDDPEIVTRQATKGDPRITRVGRFIRRTSIDELPQILNVLNGSMSLVGPRPHAIDHNEQFGRAVRGYFARHKVKPGITGWAQVNGYRGETDSEEKLKGRVERDIYYAENWSLLFDLRILISTALVVLFQKNAH